jgi:hypothetical protein
VALAHVPGNLLGAEQWSTVPEGSHKNIPLFFRSRTIETCFHLDPENL